MNVAKPSKLGKPLSATMAIALAESIEHGGALVRHAGGYWSFPGCPRGPNNGVPEWNVGTSTVEALVARGQLYYSQWRRGRAGRRFPIAAAVTPRAMGEQPSPTEGDIAA
jgi:hypothetical protein